MSEPTSSAAGVVEAVRYVESSALLSAILERDAECIAAIRRRGRLVTSALTIAESQRAIVRAGATARLDATQVRAATRTLRTFATRCDLVAVTEDVLARAARPFPVEPVRTLDAIHLATLEILGEPPAIVTVVTRNDRVRRNAAALGYATD